MAGKARPRAWAAIDLDYFAQDTIIDLRDAFGPVGPIAFLALILEARKQASAGGKPGFVSLRFKALAGTVGCTAEDARGIVQLAERAGLVALQSVDDRCFTARMLKSEAWDSKDPNAAGRQANQRDKRD